MLHVSLYMFGVRETSIYCARGGDIIQNMKYISITQCMCTIIILLTFVRAEQIYDETRDIYCSVLKSIFSWTTLMTLTV